MSRVLAHRLTGLKRQARARALVTWAEVDAALERLRTSSSCCISSSL
jgi:hypothetical protein